MRSQHESQTFRLPHHSSSSSSSSPPPASCKRNSSSASQSGPERPLFDSTYHSRSRSRSEGASDSRTQASGGRDFDMVFNPPDLEDVIEDGHGSHHDFEYDAPHDTFEDRHSAEPPADSTGGLDVDQPPGSSASSDSQAWSRPQTPYNDRVEFEVADFLYRRNQMSAGDIDFVFNLWAASLAAHGDTPPFTNHTDMYDTIDSTPLGDVPWQSFSSQYNGILPDDPDDIPSWMKSEYDVWFRDPRLLVHNIISNPDFKDEFDYAPLQEYSVSDGAHQFQDFMSGDWCWKQADLIAQDPDTIGSMFVPIILGSDKTTVSVATGHNQYWPVYMSIGNIRNNVRRAHRNGVVLLGFLAIPKADNEDTKDAHFRKFRRQLLHSSLAKMLETLKPGMTKPEVVRCPDGHFRRAVYGLGPYIADYPEQALLACIVQNWCPKCTAPADGLDEGTYGRRSRNHTEVLVEEFELGVLWDEYGLVGDIVPFTNYFPRADIHELLSPDILHQLIKGAFKDHLVSWVHDYIEAQYTEANANKILDDIDRRIALAPAFAGLRRFPEGRGFKQWTGDDSKALMKVYIPAIEGHVPKEMVQALRALLNFIYIARRIISSNSLDAMDDALKRFHRYREIFRTSGVRPRGFNLPRQHSLIHYHKLIRAFGAPNGLCSSITESKHIKAVKEPWRRSSRFEALSQMLLTNQRLDKLAASRVDFVDHGMLRGTCLSYILNKLGILNAPLEAHIEQDVPDQDEPFGRYHHATNDGEGSADEGEGNTNAEPDADAVDGPMVLAHVDLAKTAARRIYPELIADQIGQPNFTTLIQHFLRDQCHADSDSSSSDSSRSALPEIYEKITLYTSAVATFFAPSDLSGIGGMRYECIRAVDTWRNGPGRYDCVFVSTDSSADGMRGLDIARVRLFFSLKHDGITYPCALVQWFKRVADSPDEITGMWVVEPELLEDGACCVSVIHLDSIFRAAHLIPVFGGDFVPTNLTYLQTLNAFCTYYVNNFIDHHAYEIAF
ncbi:uncharacterized protein F5147DRAFT_747170 [Suillus discolor]|uniref:Uncharacterized protein n=1 Tax=Suillus discolor TaxID=1912936 RepID=A0A9P7F1M8_9AGAM|nr:uncharacterized protein F5147DRAFT_747170 [Suillus discolor]KAG2100144.1 hypothetical protein F5147DRAFT_747170 [Suillus discolor]